MYREYWPFSLKICDYSPIIQGVIIQRSATIFGDTDDNHLLEVRVLSIVNHVGIGVENTKLLCWMSYFLHLHTQLFSSGICSCTRSCINIPPVATNAARFTFYPRTLASTWKASRFSYRKANYKTGPIEQLTQFPFIYVSLNNHKWMMYCVSVYLCFCFICLCSRLVVAV